MHVGGQVGEWLSGVFAAIGTLAALRGRDPNGQLVDVSMLETLAMCLTYYPVTFNDQLGRPMRRRRFIPTPGVGAASDGLVGLGCGTGQQWLDFCVMVEHPEWMEDRSLFLDRTKLAPVIDAWIAGRTVGEVLDQASAFRIPNAPIANGVEHHHVRALRRPGDIHGQPAGRGGQSGLRRTGSGRRASARPSPPPVSGNCRSTTPCRVSDRPGARRAVRRRSLSRGCGSST